MTITKLYASRLTQALGLPGLVIIALGVLATAAIVINYRATIDAYRDDFIGDTHQRAQLNGQAISNTLNQLYQGLRTIARLPGTRHINTSSGALDAFTRDSIQEIYNNLYGNIHLSEVYLVAREFDPDHAGASPRSRTQPLVTFDMFITGDTRSAAASDHASPPLPEEEIHEYRAMREQLRWFAFTYPDHDLIKQLAYPALTSDELITCDNSLLSPQHPNDRDRSGLVYSVPFYGPRGELKGMVSGVILSQVLNGLLTDPGYILVNTTRQLLFTATGVPPDERAGIYARAGARDPDLLYSAALPLPVVDNGGQWILWTGISEADFWNQTHVQTRRNFHAISLLLITCITLALLVLNAMQRRQQALVAEANRAKSEFLSRMSHELRTPLHSIIGYSDLICEEALQTRQPVLAKDAHNIRVAGHYLLTLIDDLLDIAKIDAGRISFSTTEFDIAFMIEQTLEAVIPQLKKNGNTLQTQIPVDIGLMRSDEKRVRQILLNLLSNATKFTRGGTITLGAERRASDAGDLLLVTVKDTGIGMDEQQLQRIFHDFVQADASIARNYGGTGLGLTISRRLCQLLGGNISVSSQPGLGTEFCVVLPVDTARSTAVTSILSTSARRIA